MTKIFPFSVLLSNGTLQDSLLRYITLSYLNWPRNGEPSKFVVQKSVPKMFVLLYKPFRQFFYTLKVDGAPFPGLLRQKRVMYLKRKPYNMQFESNTETERISVIRGCRQVLVKVVLFQLRGPGHPQDDTTPNFFPDSKSPMLGLSNEVSLVSELYWEDGQNNKSVFKKKI